jgi:redox-sensitive bicupin YhaK (pirin superfamily)
MKTITGVHDAPPRHWVGDAFHVRSLFSYGDSYDLSPFILFDHAAPEEFAPTSKPRGVGWHPHRGFETVTIVYEGEVEHHDSLGNGGTIGPGDVQWMTAASGILHEEFHSKAFSERGGRMHMAQLWVNLPAKSKMTDPGYQTILNAVRVIAGAFGGANGAANTHTPLDVLDVRLNAGKNVTIPAADGHTLAIVVLGGSVRVNGTAEAQAGQLITFERIGADAAVEAIEASALLILSGVPLDEPVAGYGPFVMNTRAELVQAVEDFNAGRFGKIPA